MEYRDWATQILTSDRLEDKLHAPDVLTDNHPGAPLIIAEPVRSIDLRFHKHIL